jgi:hypothetical protein
MKFVFIVEKIVNFNMTVVSVDRCSVYDTREALMKHLSVECLSGPRGTLKM